MKLDGQQEKKLRRMSDGRPLSERWGELVLVILFALSIVINYALAIFIWQAVG